MPMPLKTVAIGMGDQMKRQHLDRIAYDPRTLLAGVVDIDEARAAEVAAKYGVPAFTSVEKAMSKLRPTLAVDAAHASSRLSNFAVCARYGVSRVLLEKPPAFNVAEAEQIRDLSFKHRCRVYFGLKLGYAPSDQLIQLFESGELGAAVEGLAWFERFHLIPPWGERVRTQLAGRGAFADLALHPIAPLRWALGNPPVHSIKLDAWMSRETGWSPWDPTVDFDHHTRGELQLGDVPTKVSAAWKLYGKGWAPSSGRGKAKPEAPLLNGETVGYHVRYVRGYVTSPLPTTHNTREELAEIVPTVVIDGKRLDTSGWIPYSEAQAYDRQWDDLVEGNEPFVGVDSAVELQKTNDGGYASALSKSLVTFR